LVVVTLFYQELGLLFLWIFFIYTKYFMLSYGYYTKKGNKVSNFFHNIFSFSIASG